MRERTVPELKNVNLQQPINQLIKIPWVCKSVYLKLCKALMVSSLKIAAKLTIGQLLQRDRSWHDESAGGIRGHGINLDCRNQSQNELSSFLYKCSDMM